MITFRARGPLELIKHGCRFHSSFKGTDKTHIALLLGWSVYIFFYIVIVIDYSNIVFFQSDNSLIAVDPPYELLKSHAQNLLYEP